MTAKHFIVWVDGGRTHVATRNAYRRGEASWRHDEARSVLDELVMALGKKGQTPPNGPFLAFSAERIHVVAGWLVEHGYTAVVLDKPPS